MLRCFDWGGPYAEYHSCVGYKYVIKVMSNAKTLKNRICFYYIVPQFFK